MKRRSGGGSMWPWLAGPRRRPSSCRNVYRGTTGPTRPSDNQSNAPTTTGAAPSAPRLVPPAQSGRQRTETGHQQHRHLQRLTPMRDRADGSQPCEDTNAGGESSAFVCGRRPQITTKLLWRDCRRYSGPPRALFEAAYNRMNTTAPGAAQYRPRRVPPPAAPPPGLRLASE